MLSNNVQTRAITAYVVPFLLYFVPSMFESATGMPLGYEAICTLKGVAAGMALWTFRHHYPAISTIGFGSAIIAGGLGCVVWIGLEWMQSVIPVLSQLKLLFLQSDRAGFNPFSGELSFELRMAFLIVRLIELTLIVPIAEELFWRGFLARYLIADDFLSVRQGTFTVFSFFIVTAAFASVHPEILSAIVWGVMINVLYRKTGNIWACVLMHAITNALLAGYILATGSWHLW